jgi:predicted DNA-binding transcriptional regulator YafY
MAPKFVERVARLPEVLTLLSGYPEGLPLHVVAAQLDVDVETLREDLVTYLDLDSWGWSFDLFQRPAIEFVQPESDEGGTETERSESTVVRLVDEGRQGLLGADYLSAGDLAVLYTAGMALLEADPDDEHLAGALVQIAETMYGAPTSQPAIGPWNRWVEALREAEEQHRRVRIVYSRSWREGVSERVIEPLRLMQTRRGWEVDAGPVEYNGTLRTFLLSNIRSVEVLDETFEEPSGVARLLDKQRETRKVRVDLAQDARWAVDMYAERHRLIDEDPDRFDAELELLEPVTQRVALLMLASGPRTKVPADLVGGASAVIESLIAHHTDR